MHITQKEKNGVSVFYLRGEISIDTVPRLKEAFKDTIGKKSRKVLLNFEEVGYIDSLGIATLIEFSKNLKAIEGVVFLSDLSPKVRTIFGIVKLEKMFKIYETEEEALKEFYGY
jgi:anti-anti-sigma factor